MATVRRKREMNVNEGIWVSDDLWRYLNCDENENVDYRTLQPYTHQTRGKFLENSLGHKTDGCALFLKHFLMKFNEILNASPSTSIFSFKLH
jgi:hypothetical protein